MFVVSMVQVDVELEAEVQQWLTRPMLGDVKDKSECAIVRLVDKQVRMIGTKKQVEDAKLLLETQIEYITKHQELRANEDKMRQRLFDMEAAYGVNRPGGNGMRQGKRMDDEYNESQGDGNGDFTRDEGKTTCDLPLQIELLLKKGRKYLYIPIFVCL